MLFNVVTNSKAFATRDANVYVQRILDVRKKLAERGGSFRDTVKPIYQTNSKGQKINKLIHKYDRAFYDGMDDNAKEGKRDVEYIKNNINLDTWIPFARKMLKKKV